MSESTPFVRADWRLRMDLAEINRFLSSGPPDEVVRDLGERIRKAYREAVAVLPKSEKEM